VPPNGFCWELDGESKGFRAVARVEDNIMIDVCSLGDAKDNLFFHDSLLVWVTSQNTVNKDGQNYSFGENYRFLVDTNTLQLDRGQFYFLIKLRTNAVKCFLTDVGPAFHQATSV